MKKWEEHVRKVVPYTPGEQPNRPGMIKLNTNENPYPPAPGVRKALEELAPESFRRLQSLWTRWRSITERTGSGFLWAWDRMM